MLRMDPATPALLAMADAASVLLQGDDAEQRQQQIQRFLASEDAAALRALARAELDGVDQSDDALDAVALKHLVRGARSVAWLVDRLEIDAARMARERGITVRALADSAGISERAAATRYSRTGPSETRQS